MIDRIGMIPASFLTNTLLQKFFQTVHVWDIATKTWFAQSTTAETELYPSNKSISHCSVVASAEDNSSHNIYLTIGVTRTGGGNGKVFILTLPAFRWVLVYETIQDVWYMGGSECLKVHEKHMVIYRGVALDTCDNDKDSKRFQGMRIYDMSSLTWTTKVELKNQKYLVPDILHPIIGGK